MSWQRILELGRRRGMPVIVTDIAGREPMILLSVAEYERLLEGASPVSEEHHAPAPSLILEEIASMAPVTTTPTTQEKTSATAEEEGGGAALEERFYLEPLEDEAT